MRKSFLFIASLYLLLGGCAQNEVFNNEKEKELIAFRTLNDRVTTRAANDASDSYGVFATITDGNAWFMNNLKVSPFDDYSPAVYYWPSTAAKLNFYAYAPHNSANVVITSTTLGQLPVVYTVQSGADEDFTVATPLTDKTKADGTMGLVFKHMLSKVTIKVKLDDQLSSFTLDNTDASVDLKVLHNSGSIDLTNTTPSFLNGLGAHDVATYNKRFIVNSALVDPTFMIMPQIITDGEIAIQLKGFKIYSSGNVLFFPKEGGSVNFESYVLKLGDVLSDVFAPGKYYTITLTISPDTSDETGQAVFDSSSKIVFTSTVSDWSTESLDRGFF